MKALDVPLNIGDIQFYKNIKKTQSNKDKYDIFVLIQLLNKIMIYVLLLIVYYIENNYNSDQVDIICR